MTTSGWVINLGEGGPRIYHTGDTMDLKQMKLVEQMYAPTHVLIPMGARCSLGPSEAAIACTEYLRTCHTVIPLLMRPTPCDSSEQSDGASLGPSATTLPLSC
jgi:L-ascorbate metabolism protein UlaG (beta-lactamase superfamily)|mmetsp:Transcript_2619/g.3545  ORF Transcript_2619/g.3545 Transcript_2619/m.3545 type:complete len:103 (+) Transcript_2619:637-945(+)